MWPRIFPGCPHHLSPHFFGVNEEINRHHRIESFKHSFLNYLGLPRWHSGKESTCLCRRLQRLGFDPWIGKIPWRRKSHWRGKWQPTPIFLPGQFHGQRSLEGYNPKGCKELDMTERLSTYTMRTY